MEEYGSEGFDELVAERKDTFFKVSHFSDIESKMFTRLSYLPNIYPQASYSLIT